MGYTTSFDGEFAISPPLTSGHCAYLTAFARTRRMRRDPAIAATLPDPVREAAGLPIGEDAGYFVGGTGDFGEGADASVVDFNAPPGGQPGLWCQWIPDADGAALIWDGGEKFYSYVHWLEYLIDHFLWPWGYTLDGRVIWQGESPDDAGVIDVQRNVIVATATAGIEGSVEDTRALDAIAAVLHAREGSPPISTASPTSCAPPAAP